MSGKPNSIFVRQMLGAVAIFLGTRGSGGYPRRLPLYKIKISVRIYLCEIYDDSRIFPLDDEVGIDLDGEVPVVDLQDLEVVKPDRDVHRLTPGAFKWRDVSEEIRSL